MAATEGSKAPEFTLTADDGSTVSLSDYAGKYVVVYFYPKDDTPGCTREACGFRDTQAEFAALNAVVLGVSILDEKSKAKFKSKHSLNFPLLADVDGKVAEAFGVWKEKSLYGKTYMGVSRETFVIGPDMTILKHYDKAKGSEEHSVEILDFLKSLS